MFKLFGMGQGIEEGGYLKKGTQITRIITDQISLRSVTIRVIRVPQTEVRTTRVFVSRS
jgi:hypothetical protein